MAASPVEGMEVPWPSLEEPPPLGAIAGLTEFTVVGAVLNPDNVAWLAASPLLSTLHDLNLVDSNLDVGGMDALLASAHLSTLEALRLPVHRVGNEGIELLVQMALPHLRHLDLSVPTPEDVASGSRAGEAMDADGAFLLAQWPVLRQLRSLNLSGNQLELSGLRALLGSGNLAVWRRWPCAVSLVGTGILENDLRRCSDLPRPIGWGSLRKSTSART